LFGLTTLFIKIQFGAVIIDEVVWECIHAPVPKMLILTKHSKINCFVNATVDAMSGTLRLLLARLAFAVVRESIDPE
jgi:hypothetical protein